MQATDRDRRHFARIAEAKRVEQHERRIEAASRDPLEKIALGLELGLAFPLDESAERSAHLRALGQAELHARWRRLQRR